MPVPLYVEIWANMRTRRVIAPKATNPGRARPKLPDHKTRRVDSSFSSFGGTFFRCSKSQRRKTTKKQEFMFFFHRALEKKLKRNYSM